MARRVLPVSRLKTQRRKRRAVLALIFFIFLLLLVGVVIIFSWMPFLRVQNIEISGVSSVNTETVTTSVQKTLGGTRWYVFANDNIFLYSKEKIEMELLRKYPIFGSVAIRQKGFDTVSIQVTERMSQALWCGESQTLSSPCYLLDKDGVAYAPATDFSNEILTEYYGPLSSDRQFLDRETFHSLSAFAVALRDKITDDRLASIEILDNEVHANFASNFTLMFMLAHDGAGVLERLTLALTSEPFTNQKLSDFEYLDLRFGDKLYYKLK